MGLKGNAAIVGAAQYRPEKYATAPRMFHLEQVADLAGQALADAGLKASDIDGLVIHGPQFHEAQVFVPAMAAEYLGLSLNFAEVVDLGGCSSVAAVWRAAMAVEMGLCQAVLCVIPARMAPFGPDEDPSWMARAMRFGGHSTAFGAPEAEFDLPYGHMGQNTGYAMIAQRYAAKYGYDPVAMAKIAVDQRTNALANPAAFRDSWLYAELHKTRNFKPYMKKGLYLGSLLFGIDQVVFRGKAPWTLRNSADHDKLKPAAECAKINYPKPDGVLTFDRLSSVFLSNTNHEEEQPCHLQLKDGAVPIAINLAKYDAPEQRYCPAGVYEIVHEEAGPRLQINAQNCVHCKTCDIKDPTQNINWVVPQGGEGPIYQGM